MSAEATALTFAAAALTMLEKRYQDPKARDLARMGYRNENGSKFNGTRRDTAPEFNREAVKARRKAERSRKRDQRRKARR